MILKEKQWGSQKMGTLRPNAEYEYWTIDGVTYSKDKQTLQEEAIGWEYDPRTEDGKPLIDHLRDNRLWGDIRRKAEDDPQLQDLLDRAKIYYTLKYDNAK